MQKAGFLITRLIFKCLFCSIVGSHLHHDEILTDSDISDANNTLVLMQKTENKNRTGLCVVLR